MRPKPLRPVAWLAVAAVAVVVWAHAIPFPGTRRLDAQTPFTQLAATRPALVLGALLLGAAWLALTLLRPTRATRSGRAATPCGTRAAGVGPPAVLLLVALLAAAEIAPRGVGSSAPEPSGGAGVTVLAANVLLSRVAPATITRLVRRTRAQVVALPEANALLARRYARSLTAATRRPWRTFTEARGRPEDDRTARSTSLLVRADLRPQRLVAPPRTPGSHGDVRVRLAVRRGPPMVLAAVHPLPPPPAESQRAWREDLLALRPACAAGEVLAGDLNATLDHSPLRALLAAGCEDAAAENGQGLRPTWSGGPLRLVRPAIDHVLTSGRWRATAAGVLPIDGSDHRAVWARVAPRP